MDPVRKITSDGLNPTPVYEVCGDDVDASAISFVNVPIALLPPLASRAKVFALDAYTVSPAVVRSFCNEAFRIHLFLLSHECI